MECMSPESMFALSRLDMARIVALLKEETFKPEESPSRRLRVGATGPTPVAPWDETTTDGGPEGVGDWGKNGC